MEDQAPDHEEIHLPSPSVAPIIVAGGITFTVVGVLNPSLFVVGLVMLAVGIAIWAFSRG
jgi:hypothetical protein